MTDVTTQYENDAFTTITDATLAPATLVINVTSDTNFPAVASPTYFYATLEDTAGQVEIVKVTTHVAASNQFTVERGADNTSALTFAAGDYIEMRPNSAVFEELRDAITSKDDITSVDSKISGLSAVYVDISGDTMTGHLKGITPLAAGDLTRKDYVDQFNFLDIAGGYPGLVLNNSEILSFIAVRAYSLPLALTGSLATSSVAPGSNILYAVKKNGLLIGNIKFATVVTGTFRNSTDTGDFPATTFASGDILSITAPADTDGHEGFVFNITGSLIL